MKRTLYLRRDIVGPRLDIAAATITAKSQAAQGAEFTVDRLAASAMAAGHPELRKFFSQSYRLDDPLRAAPADPGVATWPVPKSLPQGGRFLFVSALAGSVAQDISRDFWFEITITLGGDAKGGAPLVGGLCFAGHPSLAGYVDHNGLPSANAGIAREWRLTWDEAGGAADADHVEGYIDLRQSLSRQIPAAHGGLHYLAIRPVRTTTLTLRLGDWPRILLKSRDPNAPTVPERWGILIPFIGVFGYEEGVRRGAQMDVGLVCATQSPPNFAQSYLPELAGPAANLADQYHGVAADFVGLTPRTYLPYSAAAALGQAREYVTSADGTRGGTREVFVSNPVRPGGEVRLLVAQAECFGRTVAGIKLRPLGAKPPPGLTVDLAPFRVEIYEMETLGGASPARQSTRDPSTNDYAVKLFTGSVDEPTDDKTLVCPFERPSNAPYFVIVLTAQGQGGHIGVAALDLVRSAHVAAVPRPARRTIVSAVNVRIVAPALADDYATIGPDALGLAIERHTAAAGHETIVEARTLVDIIDRMGGRIHRNARNGVVVREVARSYNRATGWRRTETGDGVSWNRPNAERAHADDRWPTAGDTDDPGFTAQATQETRTHLTHVGPQNLASSDQLGEDINNINNIIGTISGPTTDPFIVQITGPGALLEDFEDVWRGVDTGVLERVSGLKNLNLPPFPQTLLAIAQMATLMSGNDPSNPAPVPAQLADEAWRLALGAFLSGGSVGLSGGFSVWVGVNGSLSLGQMVPMANRTITKGNTGTKQLQASRTHHQLSQNLADSFDEAATVRHSISRDRARERGLDVRWQGEYADILTARIPVNLELPALGADYYDRSDERLVVRITNDTANDLHLDVWLDVNEEEARDDY